MPHNPNIPALGNQINADIPDIKENFEFHKDVFENFVNEWSDTDATDQYPAYWERTALTSADTPYTMLAADIIMEVDTSGGAVEIDLLDAASYAKRYFMVKLTDATNALTLDPSGAQTIDGESTLVLSTVDQCAMFYSDGSNWQRVFNNVLKNDEYLKATNNAGDGSVNLIKATPADQIQFGEQSSTLLAEQISTITGDTHSNTTIDNITSTAKVNVGMSITGSGIPAGTTVATIASSTSITISQAATGTTAGVTLTLKTSTAANQMAIYSREHQGHSELFVREESSGDEITMTKQGVPWLPSGIILPYAAATAPTGWLECNGADVSMTDYEELYDIIGNTYGLNTGENATFDNTTDTVEDVAHGLSENDIVELSNSGGALPTGLAADTKYFAVSVASDTFQLSTTSGGSAINFTDDGTGTHSYHNEMKLPDLRGQFIRGWDHGAGTDPDAASRTDRGDGTTGDNVGTKQADEVEAHTHGNSGSHDHDIRVSGGSTSYNIIDAVIANASSATDSEVVRASTHEHTSVGGNENRPININMMYIIKT